MDKKTRLGRGLDALLGGPANGGSASPAEGQPQVAVDAIDQNPYQPRRAFDEDELKALGDSIKTHGVLQPLVVRAVGDRYQLIAGERRLRAARAVGLATVPVHVVDFNDQQVLEAALIENIHRTDLNPIEKAQGFRDYLERFHMTHDELAKRLGLARVTITNLVGLLDLAPEVQDEIRRGQLNAGHGKMLKGIPDPARQVELARQIIARGLSVHAAEAFVKEQMGRGKAEPEQESSERRPPVEKTAHVKGIEDELRQRLATKVEVRLKDRDRGQIVLAFESNDDFERILEVLRR
ncbi:MAG TPA: ParB/RepB/Spo0J family partition protein [Gemmataceae bacterium]|nr:ParB/RepB/Spo0J family partition protein [Gemmataceae bacterium]